MKDIKSKEDYLRENIGLIPFIDLGENKGRPILNAMSAYAKQEAIEFLNFICNNKWRELEDGGDLEKFYSQYLQSKQK